MKQINIQRLPDNQVNMLVDPPMGYSVYWWWKGNHINDQYVKYQIYHDKQEIYSDVTYDSITEFLVDVCKEIESGDYEQYF